MHDISALISELLSCPHQGAQPGQLTKDELLQLVLDSGTALGFASGAVRRHEHKVSVPMFGKILPGYVDRAWIRPADKKVVVAWEIDGINAGTNHIHGHVAPQPPGVRNAVGIIRKLGASNAPIRINALYSYRIRQGKLSWQGLLPAPKLTCIRHWHDTQTLLVPRHPVRVVTDVDLTHGMLMQIAHEATTYLR